MSGNDTNHTEKKVYALTRTIIRERELEKLLGINIVPNTTSIVGVNKTIFGVNSTFTSVRSIEINLTEKSEFYEDSILCGFPSFCTSAGNVTCLNTPLKECDECDMAVAGLFAAICIVVGCFIILGNGMVLWNVCLKRKGFEDTYSKIRGSLAAADILTGVQIFSVVLSNFAWTINSTSREIDKGQLSMRNSPQAIIGGIFYLVGFISSLYHLAFLSWHRLFAIVFPIRYKTLGSRPIFVGLAVVWILAIVSATLPAWFRNDVAFDYYHILFLYFPSYLGSGQSNVLAIFMLAVFIFLPYAAMTLQSLASGAFVYLYFRKRAKKLSASHPPGKPINKISRREISVFRTVAVMEMGFSITLLPIIVVTALFYAGNLNCDNFSTPYLICFYLSMSNSLVNVLIYSVLDPKFRASIVEVFAACAPVKMSRTAAGTKESKSNNSQSRKTTFSRLSRAFELPKKFLSRN